MKRGRFQKRRKNNMPTERDLMRIFNKALLVKLDLEDLKDEYKKHPEGYHTYSACDENYQKAQEFLNIAQACNKCSKMLDLLSEVLESRDLFTNADEDQEA